MRVSVLRGFFVVQVGLLALQFGVGLSVSLFPIPVLLNFGLTSSVGTGLVLHHYLAIIVLVFAALATVVSFVMKNPLIRELSVLGLALVIGAFLTGTAFVYVQKTDFYAVAMGVFFVLALIIYESALFLTK